MRAGEPLTAVRQRLRPHDVAVAADHGVRAAEIVRFVGIERRVNAPEDDMSARRARESSQLVSAKRVAGVNPDPDDVARLNARRIDLLEGLVGQHRLAVFGGRRGGEHVQPARRDDADAERDVTWIDQMYRQTLSLS